MVRLWSEEVGDARSVIEPLVRTVDTLVGIEVSDTSGFVNETVEVRVRKGDQEARCVVTFEAWQQARVEPEPLTDAFRQIIGELNGASSKASYVLTSRGLRREPASERPEQLRTIAASAEADAIADEFFRGGIRK